MYVVSIVPSLTSRDSPRPKFYSDIKNVPTNQRPRSRTAPGLRLVGGRALSVLDEVSRLTFYQDIARSHTICPLSDVSVREMERWTMETAENVSHGWRKGDCFLVTRNRWYVNPELFRTLYSRICVVNTVLHKISIKVERNNRYLFIGCIRMFATTKMNICREQASVFWMAFLILTAVIIFLQ